MSDTLTLGTCNIARDLRLPPQARKILAHLASGLSITPMQAQTVYSCFRLAARIFEIREAGYDVVTQTRMDMQGHPYGHYTLAVKKSVS